MTRNENNVNKGSNERPDFSSIGSHNSHSSHASHRMIQPRGGYETLLSYKKAEVAWGITLRFTHKFLARRNHPIEARVSP